jgi:HPt (histidine-containing phosphotransfer) domain-containing protein
MARTESSNEGYMMQPEELSPDPVLNLSELLARVDNDCELLREVIGICKVEIPRHLSLLRDAVAQADVKNIEKSGHTLKGMLSQLAATRAAAAAGRLEQLGRSGDTTTSLRSAVALFESEVARLMTELEAYMASIHS